MAELDFIFDGEPILDSPLAFSFSRAVATKNYDGSDVASGDARYGRAIPVAPAATIEDVSDCGSGSASTEIIGSGPNAAGTDSWLVIYDNTGAVSADGVQRLTVVKTSDPDFDGTDYTDTTQYTRTLLQWNSSASQFDIMMGTETEGHTPHSAVVVYGCVVLGCYVFNKTTGNVVGTSVIYANDADDVSGTTAPTWTLFWQDGSVASPYASGKLRGAVWALSNFFAPGRMDERPLLSAWLAGVDYQNQTGTIGGRSYLFRMTREDVGEPWLPDYTNGLVGSDKVATDTWTEAVNVSNVHSSGVFKDGNDLCWATTMGDSALYNRVVLRRFTNWFTEHLETPVSGGDSDYTVMANWETLDNGWHGIRATGTPPVLGTNAAEEGGQFVGMATDADGTGLICGSDGQNQAVIGLTANDDGKCALSYLGGSAAGGGHQGTRDLYYWPQNFRIVREWNTGAYVCSLNAGQGDLTEAGGFAYGNLILYSVDGSADTWAQVMRLQSSVGPVIVGSYIYWAQTGGQIKRIAVPTLRTVNPLVIGPGGFNGCLDTFTRTNTGGTITIIARDADGHFYDGTEQLPDPPVLLDHIVKVESTFADSSATIGHIEIDSGSSFAPALVLAGVRGWMLDGSPDSSANAKGCMANINLRNFTTGTSLATSNIWVSDRWMPFVVTSYFDNTGTGNASLQFVAGTSSTKERNRFFFAPSELLNGNQFGYPLAGDDGLSTVYPDETANVTGFTLSTSAAWTAIITCAVAPDCWDQCVADSDRLITLWNLSGSATNNLQVKADLENKLIKVVATQAGVATTINLSSFTFLRNAPIHVGVSYAPATNTLNAAASVSGSEAVTDTAGTPGDFTASLTGFRMRDISNEVNGTIYIGGRINTTSAMTTAELADALENLEYLPEDEPAAEVTLPELTTVALLKSYLNISGTDDDALLLRLILSAEAEIRQIVGRPDGWLNTTAHTEKIPGSQFDYFPLIYTPVTAITSVKVFTGSGVSTTMDSGEYRINDAQDAVLMRPNSYTAAWDGGYSMNTAGEWGFPTSQRSYAYVEVIYTGGYSGQSTVPEDLEQYANEYAAWMYWARKEFKTEDHEKWREIMRRNLQSYVRAMTVI